MSKRVEFLCSGFGGQGVVRVGQIIGDAAVQAGLHATMLISHGTETRGGYVRSQVIISEEPIASPVVETPTCFVALSQAAWDRFGGLCRSSSFVLYNPDKVTIADNLDVKKVAIQAEQEATNRFGEPLYANTLWIGVFSGLSGTWIREEHFEKAIRHRISRNIEENIAAFYHGRALFNKLPDFRPT